jgi:hypothetical protein
MARTNVPLTTLVANSSIDIAIGTAIDQGNGMNVAFTLTGFPAGANSNLMFLLVETTNGADKTVTIKKGVDPPAFFSEQGDLVVTAHAATGGCLIGPLLPVRFAQSNDSINIDFQSGITGWITAYQLPKT